MDHALKLLGEKAPKYLEMAQEAAERGPALLAGMACQLLFSQGYLPRGHEEAIWRNKRKEEALALAIDWKNWEDKREAARKSYDDLELQPERARIMGRLYSLAQSELLAVKLHVEPGKKEG